MGLVDEKKKEVEQYLCELEQVMTDDFKEYSEDLEKRLACERALEKIIESIADLAKLVINEKGISVPLERKKTFFLLAEEGLISAKLAERLSNAYGMRSFLIHQYGVINDEIIFDAIQNKIFKDVRDFLGELR